MPLVNGLNISIRVLVLVLPGFFAIPDIPEAKNGCPKSTTFSLLCVAIKSAAAMSASCQSIERIMTNRGRAGKGIMTNRGRAATLSIFFYFDTQVCTTKRA